RLGLVLVKGVVVVPVYAVNDALPEAWAADAPCHAVGQRAPCWLAPMVVKSMLADDCACEVTAPASKAAMNTRRNRLDTFSMALLLP
ncbi:MAG: hypothetical protein KA775_00485, partial [Ottowia sp.]|nr:hypothetical protein [Ottowia sp.]